MVNVDRLYERGVISENAMQRLASNAPRDLMNRVGADVGSRAMGMRGGGPQRPVEGDVIPPSSPTVSQAINRLRAWLPTNERNGPNPVIRRNIEIMERGGPIAETMAKHTLKTWDAHPNEMPMRLEAPTIEHE